MDKGVHRGFITYAELSKSLGKRHFSQENIEQAFLFIFDNKVCLVEKKTDYRSNKKKEGGASENEKSSDLDKSDDPIRMYLREMGGVELLSREGEIAIAKRIEAGKKIMLNTIDLFAGCGGLTDGFKQSGEFKLLAGVEWDKHAINTLRQRLSTRWNYSEANSSMLHFDIQ